MANIKSAKKKAVQAVKHREANIQKKTKLRTFMKKARAAVTTGEIEETKKTLEATFSVIDKSAKKNIIHKNKANRLKSKLAKAAAKQTKKA